MYGLLFFSFANSHHIVKVFPFRAAMIIILAVAIALAASPTVLYKNHRWESKGIPSIILYSSLRAPI